MTSKSTACTVKIKVHVDPYHFKQWNIFVNNLIILYMKIENNFLILITIITISFIEI